MTTTTARSAVAEYLDRVRVALADLDDDVRIELLEDLEQHLTEVAAEGDEDDEPLERRLGPPECYAAVLRVAAGLDDAPPVATSARRARFGAGLWSKVRDSSWYRGLVAFLPELRPGWWVLRGYLVVLVLAGGVGGGSALETFPVPGLVGSPVLDLAAVTGAVVASVALGRRQAAGDLRLLLVLDVVLVPLALVAVPAVGNTAADPYDPSYRYGTPLDLDGGRVSDIYAYDRSGALVRVALYDEHGQPLGGLSGYATGGPSAGQLITSGGAEVSAIPPAVVVVPRRADEPSATATTVRAPAPAP